MATVVKKKDAKAPVEPMIMGSIVAIIIIGMQFFYTIPYSRILFAGKPFSDYLVLNEITQANFITILVFHVLTATMFITSFIFAMITKPGDVPSAGKWQVDLPKGQMETEAQSLKRFAISQRDERKLKALMFGPRQKAFCENEMTPEEYLHQYLTNNRKHLEKDYDTTPEEKKQDLESFLRGWNEFLKNQHFVYRRWPNPARDVLCDRGHAGSYMRPTAKNIPMGFCSNCQMPSNMNTDVIETDHDKKKKLPYSCTSTDHEYKLCDQCITVFESVVGGQLRYCAECKKYKPDRSHHCKRCKDCVLRMDHHCPWINNCVGFNNHKYFINLLVWGVAACGVVFGAIFPQLINHIKLDRNLVEYSFWYAIYSDLPLFTFLVVLMFVGMGALWFLGYHISLIYKGTTHIEYKENYSDMKSWRNHRFALAQSKFGRSAYQNFTHFLGPWYLWLIPVPAQDPKWGLYDVVETPSGCC